MSPFVDPERKSFEIIVVKGEHDGNRLFFPIFFPNVFHNCRYLNHILNCRLQMLSI